MPGKNGIQRPDIYLLHHKLNFKSVLKNVCVRAGAETGGGKKGTDEKRKGEKSGGKWKKTKAGINQQSCVGY